MKQKDVLKIITYLCVVMTMLFIATLAIFYVKHNFRVKDADNNKHATDFIEQENKKIIDDDICQAAMNIVAFLDINNKFAAEKRYQLANEG